MAASYCLGFVLIQLFAHYTASTTSASRKVLLNIIGKPVCASFIGVKVAGSMTFIMVRTPFALFLSILRRRSILATRNTSQRGHYVARGPERTRQKTKFCSGYAKVSRNEYTAHNIRRRVRVGPAWAVANDTHPPCCITGVHSAIATQTKLGSQPDRRVF